MKLAQTLGLLACLFGMAWIVQADPPASNIKPPAPYVSGPAPGVLSPVPARSILLRTQVLWLSAEKFTDFADGILDGKMPFGLYVGKHDSNALRLAVTHQLGGKILAEPTLLTAEDRPATLVSGGEIPFLAPGQEKSRADWLTFGTKLEFLPRIQSDGKIWMRFRFEQTNKVEGPSESSETPGAVQTVAMTAGSLSEGVATVKPGESVFAIIPDSRNKKAGEKNDGLVMVFTPEIVDEDPNVTPAISPMSTEGQAVPEVEIQTANIAELNYQRRTDLSLEVSETGTIQSPEPIRSVSGFRSDLIAVSALNPQQLEVKAKGVGSTDLLVTDKNGRQFQALVKVKPASGTQAVQDTLRRLFPAAQVDVISLNESLLLRGSVTQAEQIGQITEIAEQYAPKVINHLIVDDGLSPQLPLPPAMRFQTVIGIVLGAEEAQSTASEGRYLAADVEIEWTEIAEDKPVKIFKTLLERVAVVDFSMRPTDPYPSDPTYPGDLPAGSPGPMPELKKKTENQFGQVVLIVNPEQFAILKLAQRSSRLRIQLTKSVVGPIPVGKLNRDTERLLRQSVANADPFSQQTDRPDNPKSTQPQESGEVQQLRREVKALHNDVKRLLEILQQREARQDDVRTSLNSKDWIKRPS